MDRHASHYGIRELVEASGISRRTIRYYVQLELIPPPLGAGRGHYYLPVHLALLRRITELQDHGLSLAAIRTHFAHLGVNAPGVLEDDRNAEAIRRAVEENFVADDLASELQAEGTPTVAIPTRAASESAPAPAADEPPAGAGLRIRFRAQATASVPAQRVVKLLLAPGLEIHVTEGRTPPTRRQLARLAAAAQEILAAPDGPAGKR